MKNIFYIVIIFFFSCGDKTQENTDKEKSKPLLSIIKVHSKIDNIETTFINETENWRELNSLNLFLSKFKKTSPNEALSNALELKDLMKSLKDSLIPEKFDIPSFNARINILNNEVLRLTDLTYISSINAEEVNVQVDKVLSSFSSLKGKINTIVAQKKFEDAIDFDINFIGIDSTKLDSISRKSIQINKEEIKTSYKLNKEGFIGKKTDTYKKRKN